MPLLGGACKFAGAPAPAGGPRFTGGPYEVLDFDTPPGLALSGIEIDADGGIEGFNDSSGNLGDIGRWDNGLGTLTKSDYQFRLDVISGILASGSDATDTWLPASAGLNSWFASTSFGIRDFEGTLRVRLAVSPFTEYDSESVNLYAESTP